MNVVVFASRKGGSGKSTLTAHVAAHAAKPSRPSLLIDTDPQGSLSLWHGLRGSDRPAMRRASRGLKEALHGAAREGYEWAFVDTPPHISPAIANAIDLATLVVIPTRPSLFDLAAVQDTIALCRELRTPYAVVMNGAPAKRHDVEAPTVADARQQLATLGVPVWSGQITQRSDYVLALNTGAGAKEHDAESAATVEVTQLWSAIERSVRAINSAHDSARVMHRAAA